MMNRKDEICVTLTCRQLCLLSVLLEKDISKGEELLLMYSPDSDFPDEQAVSIFARQVQESVELLHIIDDARDSIFN